MPLVFTTILPAFAVDPQAILSSDADLDIFIDRMPAQLKAHIDFQKPMESMIVIMLGFMFAPMFYLCPGGVGPAILKPPAAASPNGIY